MPGAYEKLKSPCGPLISILRRADPSKYTKPELPSLIFEYAFTSVPLGRDTNMDLSVALVHQETKKQYVLPTRLQTRGGGSLCSTTYVVLPKDLPHGRYHVFFQVSDGDKVISTGHYFVTDF